MPISTEEIQRIIDGSKIEIAEACPLPGMEGEKWYIRQPDDWVYDFAQRKFEASKAKVLLDPDIAAVKDQPPSQAWLNRQEEARKDTAKRLDELKKGSDEGTLTVEEELERKTLIQYLLLLISPEDYSLADELAHIFARNQRDWYLAQKLIVDAQDKPLFNQESDAGRAAWMALGRDFKEKVLVRYTNRVLSMVQTAKNSEAGQNLS